MLRWPTIITLGLVTAPSFVLARTHGHGTSGGDAGVIALHRAGIGDDTILAKIASGPCTYDTSMAAMVRLKQAGLSDRVIAAMVELCAQGGAQAPGPVAGPQPPHRHRRGAGVADYAPDAGLAASATPIQTAGIYLAAGGQADGHQTLLRPAGQSSLKYTGNGSILFPHMAKLIVSQPSSQLATDSPRPVFFFYFNLPDHKVNSFGTAASEAAQSPQEFSLVRFRQDGGNRQVTVGRVQPYVAVSGIDPKNTLPFEVTELGGGGFKVTMAQDLAPGEYGFVLNATGERGGGARFRIYDFTVRQSLKPAN